MIFWMRGLNLDRLAEQTQIERQPYIKVSNSFTLVAFPYSSVSLAINGNWCSTSSVPASSCSCTACLLPLLKISRIPWHHHILILLQCLLWMICWSTVKRQKTRQKIVKHKSRWKINNLKLSILGRPAFYGQNNVCGCTGVVWFVSISTRHS